MKKAGIVFASIVLAVLLIRFDYNSFWKLLSVFSVLFGLTWLTGYYSAFDNYQWCRIGKVMGNASLL